MYQVFKDLISTSSLKKNFQKSLLVSSIALLAACGSDDEASNLPEGFSFEEGVTAEFRSNESYGSDDRNLFDIFLPESEEPTSLVIYVHGGGFFAGDKSAAYGSPDDINDVLEAGVAYATINYSLLDVPGFNNAEVNDTEGVEKSLSDIKEALQYIRHNASDFNINPENIAMYGVSAGAVSSLWLAYSNDMIDESAGENSIASQSTRLVAAGAIETQGSLDLVRWESILTVPDVFSFTLEQAASLGAAPFMESIYGLTADTAEGIPNTIAAIKAETGVLADFRSSIDLPSLIDANDPAVFVSNEAVSVTDTLTAFSRVQAIPDLATAAYLAAMAALQEDDFDTYGAKFQEAADLKAEGEALAGQLINALLHFPTHASTIMQTAMGVGAEVVANIPELLDESTASAVNPADLTVIPFLLQELEDAAQQP